MMKQYEIILTQTEFNDWSVKVLSNGKRDWDFREVITNFPEQALRNIADQMQTKRPLDDQRIFHYQV